MKLDNHKKDTQPKIEITQQQEKKYELKFDSKIIPHKGHTLYEINTETMEIKQAEYIVQDVTFDPKWIKSNLSTNKKIVKASGMIYISALNKKSALKKFEKGVNGSKNINKETAVKLF
jgi:hypothetical protein